MANQIELIAVDLDGTLLNEKNEVSDRNEKAIKAAVERGVKVVIATGKTRFSMLQTLARLGLTTPGIYNQGLIIYQADGAVAHQTTLEPAVARQVITFCEDRGFDVIAYSGDRILVKYDSPQATMLHTRFGEPLPEAVGPLVNILDEIPVNKLIVTKQGDPRRIRAIRWQLEMQLDGKGRLVQAMIPDMVEVLPPRGSKGMALKTVLKEMGITADKMMAIGDGENDKEMIELAGVGVAMGNADDRLKAVAKYTVGTNLEDGVAQAIDRFVFDGKLDEVLGVQAAPAADATPTDAAAESGQSEPAPAETQQQETTEQ
ncbi:MAG: Cof-type HAD-IIB family hydrolase [Anaerolineae bacterium]